MPGKGGDDEERGDIGKQAPVMPRPIENEQEEASLDKRHAGAYSPVTIMGGAGKRLSEMSGIYDNGGSQCAYGQRMDKVPPHHGRAQLIGYVDTNPNKHPRADEGTGKNVPAATCGQGDIVNVHGGPPSPSK
ncbi:hypothetical protein [Corynebacterium macginleyi]|uniref:hypothetical protein n=1 Tax=Corynebacterium macginleyi TaxID=38290 RepID=UPI001F471131|nr:hypothetical protein [Corynebacterium macginleyi]